MHIRALIMVTARIIQISVEILTRFLVQLTPLGTEGTLD
jgi:hypothetical protein